MVARACQISLLLLDSWTFINEPRLMVARFDSIPIRGLWIEATSESARDVESEDTALLKLIDLAHIACLLSTQRRWQPTVMCATHYPTGVDGY